MDLQNVDLLALQTTQMKQDPTTIAMCSSLNPKFRELGTDIKSVLIYSQIDDLDDAATDELAYEMHVDFYDSSLDLEIKHQLVKNSLRWHRMKGTPAAVEEAAQKVFGRSWVTEWFEYGGQPYYFKVNVEATNRGASQQDFILLEKLVDAYKNKRSWVELINIILSVNSGVYFGSCITSGEEISVYPWTTKTIESIGNITMALGSNVNVESVTIYPKEAS